MRCAAWARTAALTPIGTCGTYAGFVLIDWPLPWPRDIAEDESLGAVAAEARHHGLRVQAVVPEVNSTDRRVAVYRRPDPEWFGQYVRSVDIVNGDMAVEAAIALMRADNGFTRASPAADVLVCTHGRRDVCCGSLGTGLALDAGDAGIVVKRTSHTGGHRFAPTAYVLPEGTSWAFLDLVSLARITTRSGDAADVLGRYRGCAGLGGPHMQVLEREAFAATGWRWLDLERRGSVLLNGNLRLEAREPESAASVATWEATVGRGRTVLVPDCASVPGGASTTEIEVNVVDVIRTH